MPNIILSYRRDDTVAIAGRIFDRLVGHYGADQVFMDIDLIPFGLDFREHIQETLKRCDVLLAIVGENWAAPNEKGSFRINEENDWVRIEVEAALARKIPVVPVLIDNASLPAPASLPEGLRNLVFRQAAPVDSGRDFNPHMARLIKAMDQLLAPSRRPLPRHEGSRQEPRSCRKETRRPIEGMTSTEAKAAKTFSPPETVTAAEKSRGDKSFVVRLQGGDAAPGAASRARRSGRRIEGVVAPFFAGSPHIVLGPGGLTDRETGTLSAPLILLVPWIWVMIALGGKRLHDSDWTAAYGHSSARRRGPSLHGPWLGDPINTIVLRSRRARVPPPLASCAGTRGPNRYGPIH